MVYVLGIYLNKQWKANFQFLTLIYLWNIVQKKFRNTHENAYKT